MEKKDNLKKLLCYNIVNNFNCLYKYKCMFAHSLDEQKKEDYREYTINMIVKWDNLSVINIVENTELFEDLLLYTKECKACINNKCPGGYNCKFGSCLKELKICYNDLMYGKCYNLLCTDKINKKCINGIHLTEKKLIPYFQRINGNLNTNSNSNNLYLLDSINYNNKINTISILLNDKTINIAKELINIKDKVNLKNNFNNLIKEFID